MDLSVFAKDNFSAKDWVNNTFRQSEAQSNPEGFASSIVMKLQLAIYEISTSLESTSGAVVQNLPRLLRDIELLQNEVVHFQRKLSGVEEEVSKVEKDTTHSLQYLTKLDTVKKKMEATSKALKEADNWTTLMTDIEEVFESNDLTALSQRLNSLRQSLDLLSHVSDYSERLMQLDGLRNRLEALASPHLVSAISCGDAAKTSSMVEVFNNMDRLEQLLHYYTKCRRSTLLQQWKELCESDDANIIETLNRFHETLLTDLQDQTKWYVTVFRQPSTNSTSALLPIYSQAFSALDPSPLRSLESLMKMPNAAEGMFLLQQLKTSADRFAHGIEAHLKEVGKIEEDVLIHLGESLYQTFRLLISNKYKPLVQQYLTEQFTVSTKEETDTADRINELRQSHSKISSLMESTVNDCVTLTHGCGLQLLIETWNGFLTVHLLQYKSILNKLQETIKQPGEDSLHVALSLLQILGELLLVLEENDSVMAGQVRSCSWKLSQAGPPFSRYKSLYLESPALRRLEELFKEQEKNASHSYLKPAISAAVELNSEVQSCIFETLMNPIRQQIVHLGSDEWANIVSGSGLTEDLPVYAPMEYITQVGQYLMMLPQHLEPFVMQENKGLARALSEHAALMGRQAEAVSSAPGQPSGSAEFLLDGVAKASANALSEAILHIESVSAKAAKQLAADIDYLGNIFEDLGLALPASLSDLVELFRAAAVSILSSDTCHFKAASEGKDHRLVARVRSMSNLPSHD